jgi:site-specific recombinase
MVTGSKDINEAAETWRRMKRQSCWLLVPDSDEQNDPLSERLIPFAPLHLHKIPP